MKNETYSMWVYDSQQSDGPMTFETLRKLFESKWFSELCPADRIIRHRPDAPLLSNEPEFKDITAQAANQYYQDCGFPDLTERLDGWPELFTEQVNEFLLDELQEWQGYHEYGGTAPNGDYDDSEELREMYHASVL